jgi:hypothetical protein
VRTRNDVAAKAEYLKQRWVAGTTLKELAVECGCYWQTIRYHIRTVLPKDVADAIAKRSLFKKGHHSDTQWKKGTLRGVAAREYVPIGTKRLRYRRNHRGRKIPYFWKIKARDKPYGRESNWISLAQHRWEEIHGPLPDGYAVVHIDGNRLNDEPSNLKAVHDRDRPAHSRLVAPEVFTTEAMSRRQHEHMRDRRRVKRVYRTSSKLKEAC